MLKFRANASCRLKQEDLKWASLGRASIREYERKGKYRETHSDLGESKEKGNSEVRRDRPFLTFPNARAA